jgi:twitching motility protein PilT
MPTHSVKNFIRRGEFFKMMSSMETGASEGMWTYARYRSWLETKKNWHLPGEKIEDEPAPEMSSIPEVQFAPPPISKSPAATPAPKLTPTPLSAGAPKSKDDLLEIEPEEGGLEAIISKLKSKP